MKGLGRLTFKLQLFHQPLLTLSQTSYRSCQEWLMERHLSQSNLRTIVLADISYLRHHQLPADPERSQRVISQSPLFTLVNGVLCFTGKGSAPRPVMPKHLHRQLMDEHHRGRYGSHFSGNKVFKTMSRHWWWQGMHGEIV
jgi:hypothetical protein